MFKPFTAAAQTLLLKVLAILLLLVVAAFGLYYWYTQGQASALEQAKIELNSSKIQNQEIQRSLDDLKKSLRLETEAREQLAQNLASMENRLSTIQRQSAVREASIQQRYAKLEELAKTPEERAQLAQEKAKEISTSRVDQMWRVYCQGNPKHPQCAKLPQEDAL